MKNILVGYHMSETYQCIREIVSECLVKGDTYMSPVRTLVRDFGVQRVPFLKKLNDILIPFFVKKRPLLQAEKTIIFTF